MPSYVKNFRVIKKCLITVIIAGTMSGAAAGIPVEEKQLPISKAVLYFGVIPGVLIAHLIVYLQNINTNPCVDAASGEFEISILWVHYIRLSPASLMINSFLYGVLVCGILFYLSQLSLQQSVRDIKRQNDDLKSDKDFIDRKYKRLIAAANQILVPYRLDALVDKGIEDFAVGAYKPGMLQADIRSNAVKV